MSEIQSSDCMRGDLTCKEWHSQRCYLLSAQLPPARRWRWYRPWRRGWWTSWWALVASQTWQRCPCHSSLSHMPLLVLSKTEQTVPVVKSARLIWSPHLGALQLIPDNIWIGVPLKAKIKQWKVFNCHFHQNIPINSTTEATKHVYLLIST